MSPRTGLVVYPIFLPMSCLLFLIFSTCVSIQEKDSKVCDTLKVHHFLIELRIFFFSSTYVSFFFFSF